MIKKETREDFCRRFKRGFFRCNFIMAKEKDLLKHRLVPFKSGVKVGDRVFSSRFGLEFINEVKLGYVTTLVRVYLTPQEEWKDTTNEIHLVLRNRAGESYDSNPYQILTTYEQGTVGYETSNKKLRSEWQLSTKRKKER